mmetsp:Transcript_7219/g.17329  ORF Transcript_7219/g.17329 Transcript_7219/m.17329 type:complete len:236 (-) Transcript_7219:470-1177(-)
MLWRRSGPPNRRVAPWHRRRQRRPPARRSAGRCSTRTPPLRQPRSLRSATRASGRPSRCARARQAPRTPGTSPPGRSWSAGPSSSWGGRTPRLCCAQCTRQDISAPGRRTRRCSTRSSMGSSRSRPASRRMCTSPRATRSPLPSAVSASARTRSSEAASSPSPPPAGSSWHPGTRGPPAKRRRLRLRPARPARPRRRKSSARSSRSLPATAGRRCAARVASGSSPSFRSRSGTRG